MSWAVKIHASHKPWGIGLLIILGILLSQTPVTVSQTHLGVQIGPLMSFTHNVGGMLYAADATHLILDDFTYDAQGQDTYYWVGTTDDVGLTGGTPIEFAPYPKDRKAVIIPQNEPHIGDLVTMRLPPGKKITDYKYFSIYCRNALADFGSIKFPANLRLPEPKVLPPLMAASGVTSVKSREVIIMDLTTMMIKGFTFDASVPGAVFLIGTKDAVASGNGVQIPVQGQMDLRRFDNEDIKLTLPEQEFPNYEIIGVYDARLNPLATLDLPKDLDNLPVHFDEEDSGGTIPPGPAPGPGRPLTNSGNSTNGSATRHTPIPISNYIGFYSYMTVSLLAVGFLGLLQYA